MITIISGTNRKNSECLSFATYYYELIKGQTSEEVKLLALENIDHSWFHDDMYTKQSEALTEVQEEYILPADKFVFFIPEYNGGFPGVIKLFIDACSVREYSRNFQNKKAALVGVASGRAGNLRGMDHLAGVLNYLGTTTMPNKLPISSIKKLKDDNGLINDKETIDVMSQHALDLIAF
jgi:chromate reductase